ncbi:PPOX class F420-dependent oxidoreductase [Streptomyces sp. ACA25]|uniref:PPOX class F420-dependent oxidoreductase n=1 Tax=Streptomyces sp. ACA25 TaxID=3022596 RepID=UPI0023080D5B|nr:PPOX class F420-dependent oxidoreductase [Streptomyces sp. ACA25]MDB1088015.1 PPOX class F420-dependent oxidoreductase [Streptomyces sp. ACA25]
MAATLSDSVKNLLDSRVFAMIATIQADGRPQVSPVWIKRDGDDLLVSTAEGRQKTVNMQRDPRVSVVVQPAESPYEYAEIRGTAELTTEGGQELIDELSLKYAGKKYADFNPSAGSDGARVVVRIRPERVTGMGMA